MQIAGLRQRALEQIADDLVVRLPQQLHDFRRQKVAILVEETAGVVSDALGVMLHRKRQQTGFGRDVIIRFQIALEFPCNFVVVVVKNTRSVSLIPFLFFGGRNGKHKTTKFTG